MHEEIAKRSKESMLLRQELPRSPSFLALQLFHRKSCGAAWEVLKESTGWLFFQWKVEKETRPPWKSDQHWFLIYKSIWEDVFGPARKGVESSSRCCFCFKLDLLFWGEHPFPPTIPVGLETFPYKFPTHWGFHHWKTPWVSFRWLRTSMVTPRTPDF